jgi:parvulin-like peptidyl-prolyl isomerase
MKCYAWIGALCLSICLGVGCQKGEVVAPGDQPAKTVVAVVNGKPLLFGEMSQRADGYLKYAMKEEHLAFASNMLAQAKDHFRQQAVKMFIYRTIMLDEAARLKISIGPQELTLGMQQLSFALAKKNSNTNEFFNNGPQPPEIMQRYFEDGLIIEKMLNQEIQKKIRVNDQAVEAVAATIAVSNEVRRATLDTIRKQIIGGAQFEDVAKVVSECPSAKKGGDLGEFSRGKMDKAFEEVAFKLKAGEMSQVFETKFGFHVVKVFAHNKAQLAKNGVPAIPETVRASHILLRRISDDRTKIATMLYKAQYQQESQKFFEELRAKATIECKLYPNLSLSGNGN